ncbi:type VI secretion system baseplate subunit TssG [Vibrio nomapromontoriensis]|uniref:type VI secretion system baseplate subunit TssG n=1 Tax=Vibrio nomapromontoriensis TaxID=2910246 RepID=UPI003D129A0F
MSVSNNMTVHKVMSLEQTTSSVGTPLSPPASNRADRYLIDALHNDPQSFDFTQVVRLLTAHHNHPVKQSRLVKLSDSVKHNHPVKSSQPEKRGNRLSIHYQAAAMPDGDTHEIYSVDSDHNGIHLTLAMSALSGVKGVIPDYIYEELLTSLHQEESGLQAFLDIFNHRFFEITYSLRTQRWLLLQQEQDAHIYDRLAKISGLPSHAKSLFRYTLLFGQNSRNLNVLSQILNDYFELQIHVGVIHSEKRKLPTNAQSTIAKAANLRNNNALGQGLLLGSQCEVPNSGIQVYIEPIDRQQVKQLRSDHRLASAVKDIVRHYLKDDTPVMVYLLILRRYLGSPILSHQQQNAARLGEVDCLAPERFPDKKVKIRLR